MMNNKYYINYETNIGKNVNFETLPKFSNGTKIVCS